MGKKKKYEITEDKQTGKFSAIDYKPEYCQAIIDYFNIEPYEEVRNEDGLIIDRIPVKVPLLGKFAASIGTTRSTIHRWKNKYPEFAIAYETAQAYQEDILLTNGLLGLYKSASVVIFAMKNILQWRDKIETTHEGSLINDLVAVVSKHNQKKDFIQQRDEFRLIS